MEPIQLPLDTQAAPLSEAELGNLLDLLNRASVGPHELGASREESAGDYCPTFTTETEVYPGPDCGEAGPLAIFTRRVDAALFAVAQSYLARLLSALTTERARAERAEATIKQMEHGLSELRLHADKMVEQRDKAQATLIEEKELADVFADRVLGWETAALKKDLRIEALTAERNEAQADAKHYADCAQRAYEREMTALSAKGSAMAALALESREHNAAYGEKCEETDHLRGEAARLREEVAGLSDQLQPLPFPANQPAESLEQYFCLCGPDDVALLMWADPNEMDAWSAHPAGRVWCEWDGVSYEPTKHVVTAFWPLPTAPTTTTPEGEASHE